MHIRSKMKKKNTLLGQFQNKIYSNWKSMGSWVGTKKKVFCSSNNNMRLLFRNLKSLLWRAESVALAKTRYPIIVHDQAFRIITCQPPIESGRCRGRDRTEVELCNQCLLRLFHFFCVYELFSFKSIRHNVASMETLMHRLTARRKKMFLPI